MKLFKGIAIATLSALAIGAAQADTTTFAEGFEDVASLSAKGWSIWNLSERPNGPGWIQGNAGGWFAAEDGPLDSYALSGYFVNLLDDPLAPTLSVSTWLVTPELQMTGQDILHFSAITSGGDSANSLRTLIGPGSATSPDQFMQMSNLVGLPSLWVSFNWGLPATTGTVRIAFELYGTTRNVQGLALDSVSVTSAVPEPSHGLLLGMGLGGMALLLRRRNAAPN